MEQNKMVRKYYTPEQKVKIIREHLENQVPLSELSEKYQVHMNDLYRWKKQLFEGAAQIFLSKQAGKVSPEEKENERLKEKLKAKDQLISELVEENISLKKKLNGTI
jgi:transposase-like protein